MAITTKQELRALSADERELIDMSGARVVKALTDAQLSSLVKRTRTKRDRARTLAERQRRELRGKSRARGATPVKADDGSQLKLAILTAALARLDAETARRGKVKAKAALVASAKMALSLKQKTKPAKGTKAPAKPRGPAKAVRGKTRVAVKNHVPGSVRGSVRSQGAKAQARRDSR
ncbi:hypothetical protein [Reyranella sp.]|uniref:hypothetical protein n=1 Tax=Reyranella sp. TaxID=1929291 RepID=UPI003F70817D